MRTVTALARVTALVVLSLSLALGRPTTAEAVGYVDVGQRTGYPEVRPWSTDDRMYCLRGNPSCGRDPWWAEWNALQGDDLVQFTQLGSGLLAERRFIEAVNLLWQWEEGKALLRASSKLGVTIRAGSFPGHEHAIAAYSSGSRLILVKPDYVRTSTWMVASVLAHELQHAADHAAGAHQGPVRAECYIREQRAYAVERRFLLWLTRALVRLPVPTGLLDKHLSVADRRLASNLIRIGTASDTDRLVLSDYREVCGSRR